jgi:hypothetical protein
MRLRCAILVFTVLCALAGNAQGLNPSTPSEGKSGDKPTQESDSHNPVESYTAHFKITQVFPEGDGFFTQVSTETIARDRGGLKYFGTNASTVNGDHEEWTLRVLVKDAIAHTYLNWGPRSHVATLLKIPEQAKPAGCWADTNGRFRLSTPEEDDLYKIPPTPSAGKSESIASMRIGDKRYKVKVVAENLGTQTMDGQTASGMRMAFTPVESGAEALSLENAIEMWRSADLGLVLRQSSNGPIMGSKKVELLDLKLGDPEPSLFEPPAGYEVETVELHQVACTQ